MEENSSQSHKRLLTAVAFGLGTAALAGVVVTTAAAQPGAPARSAPGHTATVVSPIGELSVTPDTTCCKGLTYP